MLTVCFDAVDPQRVARFWSELLSREVAAGPHGGVALPPAGTGFPTVRAKQATSGAQPWGGRWSGTRTRRPRSSPRPAVRR
ncbi:VOC family protein [Actinoplanes lutulentus]|uniref:VOC family protein n=1 Tax=Actinoplanes lutulentus TaxID=1287878 RepID=UPI0015EBE937|nr:VOC family protein [Actinoplanes lutulentus]